MPDQLKYYCNEWADWNIFSKHAKLSYPYYTWRRGDVFTIPCMSSMIKVWQLCMLIKNILGTELIASLFQLAKHIFTYREIGLIICSITLTEPHLLVKPSPLTLTHCGCTSVCMGAFYSWKLCPLSTSEEKIL